MTLSDLSIKNPVFAWMLMIGLIVFGWMSFNRMGISQLPDVDFPTVTVGVTLEGASPEVMETEVTDVIEDAVMAVEGIKEVSSRSRQGNATITIEFELDRNIDAALQDVQTKIAQARINLPNEIDPPIVTKANPEDQPIMWIALSAQTSQAESSLSSERDTALSPDTPSSEKNMNLRDLMAYTHDTLKNQFTTVSGVGEVILGGYIDPNLRVWLNSKTLSENEMTVSDILSAIRTQHQEIPAGYLDDGKQETNVRIMGEANTVEEFQKIIIPQRSGQPIWKKITMGELAKIEDGLDDVRRISRHMKTPAIGLGIKKQRGTNAVQVAQAVKAKLKQLQDNLPHGMKLSTVFDGTQFIEESTHELIFTLILSALLTSIVCWLFLGSWSSTFNVLLAIPTSIVGAFTILYFMNFTLNTFTLLGLSLAIGIVVDDAIMVLENIVRYRETGMSRVKAALIGAREISFAAMAASVAILAIFVPVIFMKGIIGKFLYQFGVTMSVAVLLSLLEALTLAPMRCSQYLSTGHNSLVGRWMDSLMEKAVHAYRKTLQAALQNRWKVVIVSLLIFFSSILLTKFVKKEFVPPQDQARLLIQIQTPVGSSIHFTDEVAKMAETFLLSRADVDQYYVAVGGFAGGEINTAMIFLTLKDAKNRPAVAPNKKALSQQQLMGVLRNELNKIPGVFRITVLDLSLSGFSSHRGSPIEFTIRGPDWETLAHLSQKMMSEMESSKLMTDIDTDYKLGMPEVRVIPDREKAAERGVSIGSISETINALIGGIRAGKYTRHGKRYDIRVRLSGEDRVKPEDIQALWVRNTQGELVPLSEVVTLKEEKSLYSISRYNRERAISVSANIVMGKSQEEAISFVEKKGKEILPSGYRLVLSGSAQTYKESNQGLLIALVLGIFVAYMILGSQFKSFIHPITVLLALPFSMTGALLALLITQNSLNLYSMIGIILLMGIVKKNSILLVDFTNERRKLGDDPTTALTHACPLRLRPILMTSFATIAGAIPAAIGLGPGAEARIPMALVVIGGVFVSTFLTLYVVPCAYSLMTRIESHRHDKALQEALTELGEIK